MMQEFWKSLSTWKKFKLIVTLIVSVFALIFAIYNWQITEVDFLFFKLKISLTLLIAISIAIGYLFSSLFDYRKYRIKQGEINQLKAEIKRLKGE